ARLRSSPTPPALRSRSGRARSRTSRLPAGTGMRDDARRTESVIYRSPDPDGGIPDVDVTTFVLEPSAEQGDRPALIDGPTGRTLTYADLAQGVRGLAAGLAARGFGKGDALAVYMPNVPEYAVAFHGAASAGGKCTTVNPLYTAGERAHHRGAVSTQHLASPT